MTNNPTEQQPEGYDNLMFSKSAKWVLGRLLPSSGGGREESSFSYKTEKTNDVWGRLPLQTEYKMVSLEKTLYISLFQAFA